MTNRVLPVVCTGKVKYVTGTLTGTALVACVTYEDRPLLTLPTLLCDAINQNSIRGLVGPAETQNSNTFSYAQGYVKEQGIAVSRTVAVYRRDTKELLVSGVSGANGFFLLEWKGYTGKVAVVIFDDEAVGYNAKILDLIVTN